MRKCPFCAEPIQKEAIVCKHCKKDVPKEKGYFEKAGEKRAQHLATLSEEEKKKYLKNEEKSAFAFVILMIVIGVFFINKLLGLGLLVLIILVIYFRKKHKEESFKIRFKKVKDGYVVNRKKYYIGFGIILIALLVIAGIILINLWTEKTRIEAEQEKLKAEQLKQQIIDEYPAPKIELLSTKDPQGKADKYLLKFKVIDAESLEIKSSYNSITDKTITKNFTEKENVIEEEIPLASPRMYILIEAKNKYKKTYESFNITRDKTAQEIQIEKKAELEMELSKMSESPLQYIELLKNSWYKGGFGSVGIHSVTIKNKSKIEYSNIGLEITYFSNSDYLLDTKYYTILDKLPAGKTKTFSELNTGFIDSQASRAKVKIIGAYSY